MKLTTQHQVVAIAFAATSCYAYYKKRDWLKAFTIGGVVGNAIAIAYPVFVNALDTNKSDTEETSYQEVK